jgi:hypothetical protein
MLQPVQIAWNLTMHLGRQDIENPDSMPFPDQLANQMSSDESGSAGNEYMRHA